LVYQVSLENLISLYMVAEKYCVPQTVTLCVLLVLSTHVVVLRSDFAAKSFLRNGFTVADIDFLP